MKMASLKSVKDIQGLDYYEYRDRDFYNKFKYRARVSCHGLGLTYWCKDIEEYKIRLEKSSSRLRKLDKDEIKSNLPAIEQYITFKTNLKNNKDFMVRLEGDTAAIFSNNLDKLQELRKIKGVNVDVSEAITGAYTGIKYFVREPKHKYRIYFRSLGIETTFMNELKELFAKNKKLYPSKALNAWLYRTRQTFYYSRFLSSSFSIDYDDESTGTYLSLMLGEKLGHRYKLEKAQEAT